LPDAAYITYALVLRGRICAAKGEPVPLVLLDDPSPFRDMVLTALNEANIPWRLAYVASTLPAVRAAVKAGLGVPPVR
jgi:DNA-binding transcriptional LysR family regulator